MALVVPILRLYLLFLNVFETFKTLKPPRRSPRTGEQTPRAISQRKRDMKGCMAIWLLWCSCAVVEGVADSTVGLVMPFYNEIKAIVYLFQIITRARGAEPIYLHVMRPLVKPYVTTLDYALELVNMIGDFIALIFSIPFGFIINWWRPSVPVPETPTPTSESESTESDAQVGDVQREREREPLRQPSNGSIVGTRMRGVRQTSDSTTGKHSAAGLSRIARPNGTPQSRSDTAINGKHKIWRPPANAQEQDEYDERAQGNRRVVSDSAASAIATSTGSSTPPIATPSEIGEITMVVEEVEEWRRYPPFPSAYPTTPQVRPKSIKAVPSTQHQSTLDSVYELPQQQPYSSSTLPPTREPRTKPKAPASQSLPSRTGRRVLHSDDEPVKVQDFERSLYYKDVRKEVESMESMELDMENDNQMDIDEDGEDEGDEDDTLNVTLRTPQRQRIIKKATPQRERFPSREVSPPPELRAFHQGSQVDYDGSEGDTMTGLTGPSSLAVPSSRRRTNSNYTLSSTRASRADSEASLTTVSRASSARTISRAPSLASKPSSGSTSDVASDTSSVAGVKRPRPLQDKPIQKRVGEGSIAKRTISRPPTEPGKKENAPTGTVRARVSNSRLTGATRPLKSASATSKSAAKIPRKPAVPVKTNGYDTLDSADEKGVIVTDGGTVKRRKVKPGGPAIRVERAPSSLAQIPEEKSVGRG